MTENSNLFYKNLSQNKQLIKNNKKKQEMTLFKSNYNENNNDNINSENHKHNSNNSNNSKKPTHSSNNSNNSKEKEEEEELYFAEIDTIIPIDDKITNNAIYNIKIQSSFNSNDTWIKSCTLDDLINLRNYLLKFVNSIINLPFPTKSLLRFLPYIGYRYDERNWDILLENKFLIDNFLYTICKDKEMYKLSGFINFFSKPSTKRNPNIYLCKLI